MNTKKDRVSQCLMAKSVSLWSHLDAIKETLINQSYSAVTEVYQIHRSINYWLCTTGPRLDVTVVYCLFVRRRKLSLCGVCRC